MKRMEHHTNHGAKWMMAMDGNFDEKHICKKNHLKHAKKIEKRKKKSPKNKKSDEH